MNYEVGAKTRLADGRVTLNASVFLTKVDGLQVIADAGTCSSRIILNADAKSTGAEMSCSGAVARTGISACRRPTWTPRSRRPRPIHLASPSPAFATAIDCPLRRSCRPPGLAPSTWSLSPTLTITCA